LTCFFLLIVAQFFKMPIIQSVGIGPAAQLSSTHFTFASCTNLLQSTFCLLWAETYVTCAAQLSLGTSLFTHSIRSRFFITSPALIGPRCCLFQQLKLAQPHQPTHILFSWCAVRVRSSHHAPCASLLGFQQQSSRFTSCVLVSNFTPANPPSHVSRRQGQMKELLSFCSFLSRVPALGFVRVSFSPLGHFILLDNNHSFLPFILPAVFIYKRQAIVCNLQL